MFVGVCLFGVAVALVVVGLFAPIDPVEDEDADA